MVGVLEKIEQVVQLSEIKYPRILNGLSRLYTGECCTFTAQIQFSIRRNMHYILKEKRYKDTKFASKKGTRPAAFLQAQSRIPQIASRKFQKKLS